MRKPFQTGAKPVTQPDEPKMYPGQQSFDKSAGGTNLEGFAEKAQVKAPDQLQHISVPIGSEHVFGKPLQDPKPLHADTKMPSAAKMPSFADQEKVTVPRVSGGLRTPKV
jgi:hypothetical protein